MGDEDLEPAPEPADPEAGGGDARSRRRAIIPARTRAGATARLTTAATLVAVATGMFTLKSQIFPPSGAVRAAVGPYEVDVQQICRGLNLGLEGHRGR
jgi:hypothetical protein